MEGYELEEPGENLIALSVFYASLSQVAPTRSYVTSSRPYYVASTKFTREPRQERGTWCSRRSSDSVALFNNVLRGK